MFITEVDALRRFQSIEGDVDEIRDGVVEELEKTGGDVNGALLSIRRDVRLFRWVIAVVLALALLAITVFVLFRTVDSGTGRQLEQRVRFLEQTLIHERKSEI